MDTETCQGLMKERVPKECPQRARVTRKVRPHICTRGEGRGYERRHRRTMSQMTAPAAAQPMSGSHVSVMLRMTAAHVTWSNIRPTPYCAWRVRIASRTMPLLMR